MPGFQAGLEAGIAQAWHMRNAHARAPVLTSCTHAYAHAPAHMPMHMPMHMHIPIPSSRTCTCTCQNAYAAIGRGESRTIEQYFRRRRRSGLGTGLAQSERHRIEYHGRLANKPDAERPRSGYARRCAGVAPPPRAKNTLAAYPFLAFTLRAASGRK